VKTIQETTIETLQELRSLERLGRHSLLSEIVHQLGSTSCSDLLETLAKVGDIGSDGGFKGFTCSEELLAFWSRHRSNISNHLRHSAFKLGFDGGLIEMIKYFHYLKDANLSDDEIRRTLYGSFEASQIVNAIGWYVLDELAQLAE